MNKNDHLQRQHFLKCDEDLFNALKSQCDIVPFLDRLLQAGKNVVGIDVQERLQIGIEVALRCHQQAVQNFLPHLTTHLSPIFLLTAVYTNNIHVVNQIIPHLNPIQSQSQALELAAARNDADIVRAVLPLAPDGNFAKAIAHAVHHQNEDVFNLIYPFTNSTIIQELETEHQIWSDWHERLEWMRSHAQKHHLNNQINCQNLKPTSRKM